MIRKKQCIAMLLAGGQGSRLYSLTTKIAKPAVSFGGKYRIIDFTLSNCINSGIDTVGVLTQYQPLILNDYIGNGQPWDLDRAYGGVHILSPYQAKEGSRWYLGTANAIYQNLHFIRQFQPEYVLILSGDHIYSMDYSAMLRRAIKSDAACTIAAIEVDIGEASRFGILNVNEDDSIYEFEEKPKQPKSNLASMGIYIFKTQKLYDYLEADNRDPDSSKDFGKNVIPAMLKAGEKMMAYRFSGYWKDVGTIQSLWQANRDLLGDAPAYDVSRADWKIHSRNPISPPHYVGKHAKITDSIVIGGSRIDGVVEDSVLGSDVVVKRGAVVKNSVIMNGTVIGEGAKVECSILDENVTVGAKAVIGEDNDGSKIAVVGRDSVIAEGAAVEAGAIVDHYESKEGN